jgi:hypothetical protein
MSENLSYQSFSAISLHRAAKLLRGRYAQPAYRRPVGLHEQRAVSTVDPRPGLVDLLELRMSAYPLIRAQRQTLFAADSQPLSPLRAAALQDKATILAAHADKKPVRPRSMTRVGLKRALPLHSVLRKSKRTFNRSEGVRGVSNRMALCYSRRPSRAWRGASRYSPRGPCRFGLSPEFSTPVEKTVENPRKTSLPGSVWKNSRQMGNVAVAKVWAEPRDPGMT